MVDVFSTRSGAPSIRIDGRVLHSPYDPAREARRFMEESSGATNPSVVLVLGEGLGYVAAAASGRHPGARVLSILYSEEVFRAAPAMATPSWHPGADVDVDEFLRAQIGELDVEGLRVIEWPASAHVFPEMSRVVNEAVRQVVQELNGSFVTTCGFGRLWLRNSVANFLGIEAPVAGPPCPSDRPVLIAAPGPSLEEAVPLLSEVRPRVELWALPSACPVLADAGLEPDLVVMTDPGHYSMHHLRFAGISAPIAMPLSAARGVWDLSSPGISAPSYLLSQPVFFERALLRAAGIRAPEVAPHGTVAATALDLALASTRGPVIFAGLDLCMRDIAAHARPGAFDVLLHVEASRFRPHNSLAFTRAAALNAEALPDAPGLRVLPSLRTYAGWFDRALPGHDNRLYRLLPSPVPVRTMRSIDAKGLRALVAPSSPHAAARPSLSPVPFPGSEARRRIVAGLLDDWARQLGAAEGERELHGDQARPGEECSPLSLAYLIEPRRLVEFRRRLRGGDLDASREISREMLTSCRRFLGTLRERARDAG